jgi:hypothetical protein
VPLTSSDLISFKKIAEVSCRSKTLFLSCKTQSCHPFPVAQPEAVMPTETTTGTFYSWNESTLSWDAVEVPALGTPA